MPQILKGDSRGGRIGSLWTSATTNCQGDNDSDSERDIWGSETVFSWTSLCKDFLHVDLPAPQILQETDEEVGLSPREQVSATIFQHVHETKCVPVPTRGRTGT